MFYFRDARRQLMFETAGDLKAFLCEEYEPAVLARAVAADMIDRAMEWATTRRRAFATTSRGRSSERRTWRTN